MKPKLLLNTCSIAILMLFAFSSNAQQQFMRANLHAYQADGTYILVDGNYTAYNNNYSNDVDMDDAWKLSNFGENFGLKRGAYTLVIECRRKFPVTDTTHFNMWNLNHKKYKLEVISEGFTNPQLIGRLKDNYLKSITKMDLNSTSMIEFEINADPASYDPLRFSFIYGIKNVPVHFNHITSKRADQKAQLEWSVTDETEVEKYIVEHSTDSIHFKAVSDISSDNAGKAEYNFTHAEVSGSENFYRIKAIEVSGEIVYSDITKIDSRYTTMMVFPNPIINKRFQVQPGPSETGMYQIELIGSTGQSIKLKPIFISSGKVSSIIEINSIVPPGVYRIQLTSPSMQKDIIPVIIK